MKHLHVNPRTGLVLDPHSGRRYRVNEIGAQLLRAWQEGRSGHELLDMLASRHALTRNQAERALHTFARQCRLAGLAHPELPEPAPASVSLNPSAA